MVRRCEPGQSTLSCESAVCWCLDGRGQAISYRNAWAFGTRALRRRQWSKASESCFQAFPGIVGIDPWDNRDAGYLKLLPGLRAGTDVIRQIAEQPDSDAKKQPCNGR